MHLQKQTRTQPWTLVTSPSSLSHSPSSSFHHPSPVPDPILARAQADLDTHRRESAYLSPGPFSCPPARGSQGRLEGCPPGQGTPSRLSPHPRPRSVGGGSAAPRAHSFRGRGESGTRGEAGKLPKVPREALVLPHLEMAAAAARQVPTGSGWLNPRAERGSASPRASAGTESAPPRPRGPAPSPAPRGDSSRRPPNPEHLLQVAVFVPSRERASPPAYRRVPLLQAERGPPVPRLLVRQRLSREGGDQGGAPDASGGEQGALRFTSTREGLRETCRSG